MKSVIVSVFVAWLCCELTAGAAIAPLSAIQATSTNSSLLAGNSDEHCSSDYASYGRIHPGSVACTLAMYEFMESPRITTLPNQYPMDFVSSTAQLPTKGNGFRTPWRSTFGECTVAVALLSEVPARFTPEASATPSGQTGIVFKGTLQRVSMALQNCFKPPDGTNIGWVQARTTIIGGPGKVGIFAFKTGSPIDQALPDGPRVSMTLSSNLTADLMAE